MTTLSFLGKAIPPEELELLELEEFDELDKELPAPEEPLELDDELLLDELEDELELLELEDELDELALLDAAGSVVAVSETEAEALPLASIARRL